MNEEKPNAMPDLQPVVDALRAKKMKQDKAREDWRKLDKKTKTLAALAARVEVLERLLGLE